MNFGKFIVIENGKPLRFNDYTDIIKVYLGNDYYFLSDQEKIKRINVKKVANAIGIKDTFPDIVVLDEMAFMYWLLLINKITLLERKDVNCFTKNIDKSNLEKDYIIVNKFSKFLLDNYR